MNILVVDVGTSSMRGILFTHGGEKLIEKQQLYNVSYGENGWVWQDPSDWEAALYQILGDVTAEAEEKGWEIAAIAVTSQRSSVIPVDKEKQPLCPAIMWQDKRTNGICEELREKNDRIFALSGSRINPVFSASKMTWIRRKMPDIYEKTETFMVIPDYLIFRMTGEQCTDLTYGSRSLLMNIKTRQWDKELLELFEVEEKRLCRLIEPGSVCGYTTRQLKERTGFPEGIPVITAGGDQQCGAIGQGVVKEGILSVTAGTGGFLVAAIKEVPDDLEQDVICNVSSVKDQYILESNVLTCCSAFDWFRREFYGNCSYEELNKEIESVPVAAHGCLCLPYFQGRSTPDWNSMAKGVFANVTLGTSRSDMLRSILEGICYEIGNGIDIMKKYTDLSQIYVNGGLTNSNPFNQIQCNVYGTKIMRRGKADATARGALMVAGTAMGVYSSVEEAFETIGKRDEIKAYVPNEEYATRYKKSRTQMNRLYGRIFCGGADESSIEEV